MKFIYNEIYDDIYLCIGKIMKLIYVETNEYKWICENAYHIKLYETTLR